MNNKISIITPVYNEENNIKIFLERLLLTSLLFVVDAIYYVYECEDLLIC